MRKLAVKRLTLSDLTLFEWQFRRGEGGNQKAINLNRDVFIDELYPALPEAASQLDNRIPLDLYIYGPSTKGPHNLQRKITKQTGSYKNWRLNGEFIYNPEGDPDRYNTLNAGDLAVIELVGSVVPKTAKMVLVAKAEDKDKTLHAGLHAWLGIRKMASITQSQLSKIVTQAAPPATHPIQDLLLDADLEDAALGGAKGSQQLYKKRAGRKITKADLLQRRKNAEEIGLLGEEYLHAHFKIKLADGKLEKLVWTSDANAVAPFDFEIIRNGQTIHLDAKSTSGEFERSIHISLNELREMTAPDVRYDLYRVYEVNEGGAKFRICKDLSEFAKGILRVLENLPAGVLSDAISVDPSILNFGDETILPPLESVEEETEEPEV